MSDVWADRLKVTRLVSIALGWSRHNLGDRSAADVACVGGAFPAGRAVESDFQSLVHLATNRDGAPSSR